MGKEKMIFSRVALLCAVLLCGGCTAVALKDSPSIARISAAEKLEVDAIVAADFRFPDGKKEEAYSVIYAALRLLNDNTRIVAVHFEDSRRATIFVCAPAGSMHGSPSINAVWDKGEWKFGDWWFPV